MPQCRVICIDLDQPKSTPGARKLKAMV
jgi:hypothetical protein